LAAQEVFKKLSLSLSLVQMDEQLPTGIAQARLLPDGSAEYHFPAPVAFDRLAVTPNVFEACVVFGSLGQRDPVSALAIAEWLKKASYRVLDLNLRAPFDGDDIIHQSIKRADFLKLNEHEVVRLERLFDLKTSDDGLAQYLKSQFGVQALCITEGERGASLWWEGRKISQAALKVSVVDTVGAGDAFLAMLLTSLSRGLTPADALNKATRLAALVVTHAGAVPEYDPRLF
jgi:fructokinase